MAARGSSPGPVAAARSDFDGIAAIIKQATGSQNDALAQITATLETATALNRALTIQFGEAQATIRDLSAQIADLHRKDLDREKWVAEQQVLIRKAELEAKKTELLISTAASMGKALVAHAMLPPASKVETTTEDEDAAADELARAVAAVLLACSDETRERIRKEAGEEAVAKVARLIMKRQQRAQEAPGETTE